MKKVAVVIAANGLEFSFFFFKQKTAYEIYQCDWSSDVCSSDLAGLWRIIVLPEHFSIYLIGFSGVGKTTIGEKLAEIGRASCRERV